MTIGVFHGMARAGQIRRRQQPVGALMDDSSRRLRGAIRRYALPKDARGAAAEMMHDGRFGASSCTTQISLKRVRSWSGLFGSACLVPLHAREFGCKSPSIVCDNFQGVGLAVEHSLG